jgi:hypothetical protein
MANEKYLIRADDVRRELLREDPKLAYILDRVRPVDAVEVVRCKDCKYYEHPEYYGGGTKDVCRTFKRQTKGDDFVPTEKGER